MTETAELALVRGLTFLAENQATVAHNLANISSHGFKRRIAMPNSSAGSFNNPNQTPSPVFQEALDWSLGSVNVSGNAAHIAIKDQVFLKAAGRNGTTFYTRPTNVQLDNEGYLSLNNGYRLLDESDQPILIYTAEQSLSVADLKISPAGVISSGKTGDVISSLGVYEIPEMDKLTAAPGGMFAYRGTQTARPTTTENIVQGAQEQSNVHPTNELITMIGVQRSFQADMKALTTLGRIKNAYVGTFNK